MITLNQIRAWVVSIFGIVAAFYSAVKIADQGMSGFSVLLAAAFAVVWILFGRAYWWLPLFMGIGVGGVFYFGFKVYPYEVGVLLSLVAALPLVALRAGQPTAHRTLPKGTVLFLIYMFLAVLWSCAQFSGGSLKQAGSIGRVYLGAIWPLLFIPMFYYYGKSRGIIIGFYLLEAIYVVRFVFGVVALFNPNFTYVPGLNLILPGSGQEGGSTDLRVSGLGLCLMAMMFLLCRKGWIHGGIQALLLVTGIAGTLVGGSRAIIVSVSMAIVLCALFARQKWILIAACVGVLSLVGFVNVRPDVVDTFYPTVKRGLSILIVDSRVRASMSPEVSNLEGKGSSTDWHESLHRIGWQRWTGSIPAFFFGTGSRPYDSSVKKETNNELSFQLELEAAADALAYEAGLWCVVAAFGAVGLIFYCVLLGDIVKQVWRRRAFIPRTLYGRALAFYFCYNLVNWILFCYWTLGFPSDVLMIGFLTMIYLEDREAELNEENA